MGISKAGSKKKGSLVFTNLILAAVILLTSTWPGQAVFATEVPSGATVVVACSDYQYPDTDVYDVGAVGNAGGEIVVRDIAEALQESADVSSVDGFLCAGDYNFSNDNISAEVTAAGIASLKGTVNETGLTGGDTDFVFVQGNHDPRSTDGGTSESGANDPASGAYGVFVINERDYPRNRQDETVVKGTAQRLQNYLNEKFDSGFAGPIFVIAHLPLHYTLRTKKDGDGQYAKYIFDALDEGARHGLNIIYLYGHNHSNGWDDYLGGPKVFLEPGDEINIPDGTTTNYTTETLKFVYMNAGYVGYYKNQNTDTEAVDPPYYEIDDLSMTCFVITGDSVEIERYDKDGETVLKKKGRYNRFWGEDTFKPAYSPNEEVIEGPYTAERPKYCGPDLTWNIESEGGENVLRISGTGPMYDYAQTSYAPWGGEEFTKAVLEDGVTNIGDYAFRQCFMMEEIEIADSVETIGNYAFYDCGGLKTVDLPENLSSIGERGFYNCNQLKEISMPVQVTQIGKNAFYRCSKLTDVYYGGVRADKDAISVGDYNDPLLNANWHFDIGGAAVTGIKDKTYTGKALTQDIVVKDGEETLAEGTDYTVQYSGNTEVGTATITITGIGNYEGTVKKTFKITQIPNSITASNIVRSYSTSARTISIGAKAKGGKLTYKSNKTAVKVSADGKVTIPAKYAGTATITITAGDTHYQTATKKITVTVPAATKLTLVKSKAVGQATVKWTNLSDVSGYQIQYSTSINFTSPKSIYIAGANKWGKTIKSLTKGKKYYVRIRTYKTSGDKKYYSAWSTWRATTVKK